MLLSYAAGVFAILIWSVMPVVAKLALARLALAQFLILRFVISAAVSLLLWPKSVARFGRVRPKDLLQLGVTLSMNFLLQSFAVHRLPASWYIVIFSLTPLITLFALGLRLPLRAKLGVGLAALGTMGFLVAPAEGQSVSTSALVALVGGMITWVYYTWLTRRLQGTLGDGELSALTNVVVLPPTFAFWLADGMPFRPLDTTTGALVLALGASVPLAYAAFSRALRRTPTFGVVCQYLEPVFGVAIAWAWLGERLTPAQLLGAAVIVAGTALTSAP